MVTIASNMNLISPFLVCFILQCFIIRGNCADLYSDENVFVFAIPHGGVDSHQPHVFITTTSWDLVYATLTVPGVEFKADVTISRYQHADITLPTSARLERGDGTTNKTVIVRSSSTVAVHGIENENRNTDGFFVLPSSQLGSTYRIASYVPYDTSYPSHFCVSALDAETNVQITTKTGLTYSILLEPFETFRFDGDDYEDLTGTLLEANNKVAVISGVIAYVPEGVGSYDLLLEVLPSEEIWGRNFIIAPFMGRKSGYIYRLLSTNQTTVVTLSNIGTIQLEAEDWYEGNVTGDTMVQITSDNPLLVVQYMKGRYSESPGNGDPSMMLVVPVELYSNNVSFPVYRTAYGGTPFIYYINVITDCSYVEGLVYDDSTSMVDWDLVKTSDNTMCAIRGAVDPGVHSVDHGDPLARYTVFVYAHTSGGSSSYAYPAGLGQYYVLPTSRPPASDKPPVDLLPTDVIGLHLHCDGTNMTAIFNSSVVPFTQANEVHLLDTDCVASDFGVGQAIISSSYHQCQTQMEESDGHMVFRNALIGVDDLNSPIIQHHVNIECRVERRHMVDTSYLSNLKTGVSFGNFSFELDIYPDQTYSAPYNPEDYPVDVKVGDNLYLAASVFTVNELDLFVDSCWATPTADPWHDTSYSLILNGCPDDDTLVFHDSNDPSSERFSFHAFGFKEENWLVFVHCQLLVCDVGTPNSRCAQGCIESLDIDSARMRRSVSDLHTITSKPVVVRG